MATPQPMPAVLHIAVVKHLVSTHPPPPHWPSRCCPATLQKYIDLVAAGDPNWESHEALKDYKEEEAA